MVKLKTVIFEISIDIQYVVHHSKHLGSPVVLIRYVAGVLTAQQPALIMNIHMTNPLATRLISSPADQSKLLCLVEIPQAFILGCIIQLSGMHDLFAYSILGRQISHFLHIPTVHSHIYYTIFFFCLMS